MAYEDMTYEKILSRMLDRIVAKNPNIDTRQGSMIYDAVAPAAMECAIAYLTLNNVRNESFVGTASRTGLYEKCRELGIDVSIFDASYGVYKGAFNVQVELGSRWNRDLYNYTVTKYLGVNAESNYEYELTCETVGSAPNAELGSLTPILDMPSGLTYAELLEVLIEGENETSDDEIRTVYFNTVNSFTSDGNVSQYRAWCENYTGIGHYKIFPLWNGANTVKVSILSASNKSASETLVEEFQNYLDPNIEGMGNGVAPIGAFVTVSTATEVEIGVNAVVKLSEGYTEDEVKANLDEAISTYLGKIAYTKSQVNYMALGAAIIDCDGVEFLTNLTISKDNGSLSSDNIALGDEEIPVIGTTVWTVVKE